MYSIDFFGLDYNLIRTIFNVLLIIIFIISIVKGYKKGFVYELFSIFGSLIAFILAYLFSPILSNIYTIIKPTNNELLSNLLNGVLLSINNIIWFVIIFFVSKIVFELICPIFKIFNKLPLIKHFNKFLGIFMGIIDGLIVSTVVVLILNANIFSIKALNQNISTKDLVKETNFGIISDFSNHVLNYVVDNVDFKAIENTGNDLKEEVKEFFN